MSPQGRSFITRTRHLNGEFPMVSVQEETSVVSSLLNNNDCLILSNTLFLIRTMLSQNQQYETTVHITGGPLTENQESVSTFHKLLQPRIPLRRHLSKSLVVPVAKLFQPRLCKKWYGSFLGGIWKKHCRHHPLHECPNTMS